MFATLDGGKTFLQVVKDYDVLFMPPVVEKDDTRTNDLPVLELREVGIDGSWPFKPSDDEIIAKARRDADERLMELLRGNKHSIYNEELEYFISRVNWNKLFDLSASFAAFMGDFHLNYIEHVSSPANIPTGNGEIDISIPINIILNVITTLFDVQPRLSDIKDIIMEQLTPAEETYLKRLTIVTSERYKYMVKPGYASPRDLQRVRDTFAMQVEELMRIERESINLYKKQGDIEKVKYHQELYDIYYNVKMLHMRKEHDFYYNKLLEEFKGLR